MSVKITLGSKLHNSEILLEEANARVKELTHFLGERQEEIISLKKEKDLIKLENEKMKLMNLDLNNEIKQLKQLKSYENEENLKNFQEVSEIIFNNKEFLKINKNLKIELENLNSKLEDEMKNKHFLYKELEESEKIKNKFP